MVDSDSDDAMDTEAEPAEGAKAACQAVDDGQRAMGGQVAAGLLTSEVHDAFKTVLQGSGWMTRNDLVTAMCRAGVTHRTVSHIISSEAGLLEAGIRRRGKPTKGSGYEYSLGEEVAEAPAMAAASALPAALLARPQRDPALAFLLRKIELCLDHKAPQVAAQPPGVTTDAAMAEAAPALPAVPVRQPCPLVPAAVVAHGFPPLAPAAAIGFAPEPAMEWSSEAAPAPAPSPPVFAAHLAAAPTVVGPVPSAMAVPSPLQPPLSAGYYFRNTKNGEHEGPHRLEYFFSKMRAYERRPGTRSFEEFARGKLVWQEGETERDGRSLWSVMGFQ